MNSEITKIQTLVKNLLHKKTPDEFLQDAKNSDLKKTLTVFDLIVLGISAVIGTGIFTVIGIAASGGPESVGAGPALILSMVIAALACVFTALCYSEFASMIPVAGSAYTYTYATMGEFMAWIIGWILMLEYAIGNITVASAWTGYFFEFLKEFSDVLPSWIVNPPMWLINDYRTLNHFYMNQGLDIHTQIPYLFGIIPICINVPAILMVLFITVLLIRGVKESTKVATVMVAVKMLVIGIFITVGLFYIFKTGIGTTNLTPFAPNGWSGIFSGAFLIFFAYIGFDAISTTAEETENPQKSLPASILGTLVICTIVYVLCALVLTGIVPWDKINILAPVSSAMNTAGFNWAARLISLGALAGLTSVLLVYQLGTTRILYAMSRDNFLPKSLQKIHKKYKTPHVVTWLSGIVVAIGALFMDIEMSAELCNFGTFASFIIVCVAVLILRKTEPDRKRPFKVPFVPLFPLLGILCCGGLMIYKIYSSMKPEEAWNLNSFLSSSTTLFFIWVIAGVIFYACYCYKRQREE